MLNKTFISTRTLRLLALSLALVLPAFSQAAFAADTVTPQTAGPTATQRAKHNNFANDPRREASRRQHQDAMKKHFADMKAKGDAEAAQARNFKKAQPTPSRSGLSKPKP